MATLGLLILWSGYTFGMFGFSKIKSAYGNSPTLSLSDLALPSHRSTYLAAATSWGGSGSTATAAGGAAAATNTGSGASAPVPGTPNNPPGYGVTLPGYGAGVTIPSPQQTTSGSYVPAG